MLAILYIGFIFCVGHTLVLRFLPDILDLSKRKCFFGTTVKLNTWMITVPASFLAGLILTTFGTYLLTCFFSTTIQPLLWGHLCSISIFGMVLIFYSVGKYKIFLTAPAFHKNFAEAGTVPTSSEIYLRKVGAAENSFPTSKSNFDRREEFFCGNFLPVNQEVGRYILHFKNINLNNYLYEAVLIVLCILYWSFFMIRTFFIKEGVIYADYGDIGMHAGLIRSFSWGRNFPAEYHLWGGEPIHYHFLFQFFAAQLEFLGLPLNWAYNLPSIILFASNMMLLYSLAVLITGKREVGVLTVIMFFFESSFSIFTFLTDMDSWEELRKQLLTPVMQIGRTPYADWGIWTTNIFIKQRHFLVSFGILMLLIIYYIPLLQKMLVSIDSAMRAKLSIFTWWKEFVFSEDAWLPVTVNPSIFLGVILGLSIFFHSAGVITSLIVICTLGLFSKERLSYIVTIIFSLLLMTISSLIIQNSVTTSIQPVIKIGFLASNPDFWSICQYYGEVFGILPGVVILGAYCLPKGSRWLCIVFFAPIVFANIVQIGLAPTANHRFINPAVKILNIFAAFFIVYLFTRNFSKTIYKISSKIIAIGLFVLLIVTGVLTNFINYNIYKYSFPFNSEKIRSIAENTDPQGIFLSDRYTAHPILLAGRKIFYGWPAYTYHLGYNLEYREKIIKKIYEADDVKTVMRLARENKIKYIVIDDGNRSSQMYKLNESLFQEHFPVIYSDEDRNTQIYSVDK